MDKKWCKVLVLGVLGWSLHATSEAQTGARMDPGKREIEARCASCHGMTGKGNGPVTDLLRRSPPDLTQLARSNGGILPMERLYQSILGDSVAAHGSRDMPVWGMVYRTDAAGYYGDVPYDADGYVRTRVLSLLEYLSRLQIR
ncbi:MAG: c-type cytochrome [Limnohabitans sp.]